MVRRQAFEEAIRCENEPSPFLDVDWTSMPVSIELLIPQLVLSGEQMVARDLSREQQDLQFVRVASTSTPASLLPSWRPIHSLRCPRL